MNLASFFKKKSKTNKYYFGLFLKEEEGIGMVLSLENGKMEIKEKEHFKYSNGWENIVQDIDDLLFKSEQTLHITLDETIFFVYSHFVDEKLHDIKKPYLQKIKDIVKNLELHPLGYIECSEAVLSYLEKKEEIPLTAIVVELDRTNINVIIYKGGKAVFNKILARTDNLIDDLLASFKELKGNSVLPARIILYNSKDLDDESTKILTYRWSEDYFIQIPRVEVLKEEEVIGGLVKVFEEQILKTTTEESNEGNKKNENVMGFIIGEDVTDSMEDDRDRTVQKSTVTAPKITAIKEKISSKTQFSKRILIPLGIIVISSAISLNEYFLHSASLTVFFPSQNITKKITLDSSLADDKDVKIKVMAATSSASFSDSKTVTGKRDIGEKARGAITLHSFADNEKAFGKGTVLTAGGLKYSLDEEVKVASASLTTDGAAKLPGKAAGKITAVEIGTEGNLEKGKRFDIVDLSSTTYFAINESALTGGTKKQVTTVSKSDIEELKTSITKKAKNQLSSNPDRGTKNEIILSPLSQITLRDVIASKEVGEEATDINLKATADNLFYYVDRDDLLEVIMPELQPELKQGFSLDKQKINFKFSNVEKNDENGDIAMELDVDTKALKTIPLQKIAEAIRGKNKRDAEAVLKQTFEAQGFELTIKSPLPISNSLIPLITKNIRIIISSL